MQVGQGAMGQSAGQEVCVDVDAGDHTLCAGGAEPVVDLADDFTDVDQEQALLAGTGLTGDAGGEELYVAVREDPAAQPPAESLAAPVPRCAR